MTIDRRRGKKGKNVLNVGENGNKKNRIPKRGMGDSSPGGVEVYLFDNLDCRCRCGEKVLESKDCQPCHFRLSPSLHVHLFLHVSDALFGVEEAGVALIHLLYFSFYPTFLSPSTTTFFCFFVFLCCCDIVSWTLREKTVDPSKRDAASCVSVDVPFRGLTDFSLFHKMKRISHLLN